MVGAFLLSAFLGLWPARAETIVAEGERFRPLDASGWAVTRQDDTYASHTFGGMWLTAGACLGAPAASAGSVAVQAVTVKEAGRYRVWSKYQAPPYFNYLHRVAVVQGGRTVFAHDYGRSGAARLWSFGAEGRQAWWPWGVDHDAAEAPQESAQLSSGAAEVLLITVPNEAPAGERYVDFIVLTTSTTDDYLGYKPYSISSPFLNEALAATHLYLRFRNTGPAAASLTLERRLGHVGPVYAPAKVSVPPTPVEPGSWSPTIDIGPWLRLATDDGLDVKLDGASEIPLEFARDPAFKDPAGRLSATNGESIAIPKEIVWDKSARVRTDAERARQITRIAKTWRTANAGKKPRQVLFYGEFNGREDWLIQLKDALGYNTLLKDPYEHVRRDGIAYHIFGPERIARFAASLKDKEDLRVLSFGDEIAPGGVDFAAAKTKDDFRSWLSSRSVTAAELDADPATAAPIKEGVSRLAWYSELFNQDMIFREFRENAALARRLIGAHVLTGANYSPHTPALYYGPLFQWIGMFKADAMGLFWTEDYIHIVPEVPQIISWMLAEARCAVKYHGQPIHFYAMPHAPGQQPGVLRRNILAAVGYGARHIDNFWIAPAGRFTENYVSWGYRDTFKTLHEAIFDTAEAEKLQAGGTVRPARVAVVLSRATEFNETRTPVDKAKDPFAARTNAPEKLERTLERKEQQMLYLALKRDQHAVDLITEEDIAEGRLKDYDAVYFSGEWIDKDAVAPLADWVRSGGVLYADGGLGLLNQFGDPAGTMLEVLGLAEATTTKNAVNLRTMLELPLAEPIGAIAVDSGKVAAIGLRQELVPDAARVLARWEDGKAAVTVNAYGRGKAFAVGTLAGMSAMKTGLRAVPFARAGNKRYVPEGFDAAAEKLARLGADERPIPRAVVCSHDGVEAAVIDHKDGTLVTLLNWNDAPLKGVEVKVLLPRAPRAVRTVAGQKSLPFRYADGAATFRVDLVDADYLLLTL